MASATEDAYFPPLERCLKEQRLLFTWKDAYTAIQDLTSNLPAGAQRFLNDPEAQKLLKAPLNVFTAPVASSKAKFDSLTAAINIAPDETATYNISQIKEDALWLAKQAKIDEVAALRLAVIEWQRRPMMTLLARPLDAEGGADISDGVGKVDESIFARSMIKAHEEKGSEEGVDDTSSKSQRKARLLHLFLSERAYLLATSRTIFSFEPGDQLGPPLPGLIESLSASYLVQQDGSAFVAQAVQALRSCLEFAGTLSHVLDGLEEEIGLYGQPNDLLFLQLTSIFELIVLVSDGSSKVLSADAVGPFFKFMLDTGYLSNVVQSAIASSQVLGNALQIAISLAGLAVLKLPAAQKVLDVDADDEVIQAAREGQGCFLYTPDCLQELQTAFIMFAENNCSSAGIATLAWAVILYHLGRLRVEEETEDSEEVSYPSITSAQQQWRSNTLQSAFNAMVRNGRRFSEDMSTVLLAAVNTFQVFNQISEVASIIDRYYVNQSLRSTGVVYRASLFDVSHLSQPLVRYSAETLGALLAVIGANRSYWHLYDRSNDSSDQLADLLANELDGMFKEYFDEIRLRYPQELAPYHRLLRALLVNGKLTSNKVAPLIDLFTTSESAMLKVPLQWSRGQRSYSPDGSDQNLRMRLNDSLPYFHSQRTGIMGALTDGSGTDEEESVDFLPAGITGTIMTLESPPVLFFRTTFSPRRYMIACLCTAIPGNDFVESGSGEPVPLEDIADIIGLLAAVMLASHRVGATAHESLLDETFAPAEPSKNLLEIVAALFQTNIEALQQNASEPNCLDVIIQCVNFFHAVAVTHPTRIWPIIARSSLLDIDGNVGSLAQIISSVEMITGRYDFLLGCIQLYKALIDASLWSGSAMPESRALTRFSEHRAKRGAAESLPQRIASAVMTSFTKTLLEVFAQSREWRYNTDSDRSGVSTALASAFDKLLHYVFGFDDELDIRRKAVIGVLAESASIAAEVSVSTSSSFSIATSVLDMFGCHVQAVQSPAFSIFSWSAKHEVITALEFCGTIAAIRASKSTTLSYLEEQLYRASPAISRLMMGYQGFRSPVAILNERLMKTSANAKPDPPALLGSLGRQSSKDFLNALGYLDAPFEDTKTEEDMWKMLSAVVSSKQQWFAISLLTGRIPKDRSRLGAGKETPSRTISLFSHAVNELSEVTLQEGQPVWPRLPPELALEMLHFVASCQNHWAWAVSELRSHPKFLEAITKNYIRHLHRDPTDSAMSIATEASIAAKVAEILTMYFYSSSQLGDEDPVKDLVDHMQYLSKFGVAAPKYSTSLHNNLKSHLERQHKGLKLENFKHTLTFATTPGSNYFYDIGFASKVLNIRRSATGRSLQGFETDMVAANEDLSNVDAQIALLRGWKLLATELAKNVKPDTKLSAVLIGVVEKCLKENTESVVPQAIFDRLRHQRLELALNVLQKLVTLDFKDDLHIKRMRGLFGKAWEAIRSNAYDFDSVFAGNDVDYYRSLLQILFLAAKILTKPIPGAKPHAGLPEAQAQELIEVIVYIIIKGFKSLTSVLHEDPSRSTPSDYVLLTAMLQFILKIPGIELLHSDIALHFANNSTSTHATSLFSWADQFLIDGDPIYGELAVLYLLELSSIPTVAENLAVSGVLSQLSSARIMQLFTRAKGMGPFDNPTRMHSIWERGILPLCLNMLDAVGAPIAAEVVSFLNAYPNQLARLATDLGNRSSIVGTRPGDSHLTLGLAAETHSIALIWLVVDRYRAAGPANGTLAQEIPALEWDKSGVKEDVDDLVVGRSSIASMTVPANERDAELVRLKPLGGEGSKVANRLEERILAEFTAASECLKTEGN